MTTIFAIITEAGKGSRFFPVSGNKGLSLKDELSLFQKTFLTLTECIDDKNIISITSEEYRSSVKTQLKDLQNKFSRKTEYKTILFPEKKGSATETAAGVKYISDNLKFTDKNVVILTIPSDNIFVSDRKSLADFIEKGVKLAQEGYLVSLSSETDKKKKGMKYLKTRKSPKISQTEPCAFKVTGVTDKEKETIKGRKFVNSGIYLFKPEVFISEFKKQEQDIYKIIAKTDFETIDYEKEKELFEKINAISSETTAKNSKNLAALPIGDIIIDSADLYEFIEYIPEDNQTDSTDYKTFFLDKITDIPELCDKCAVLTDDDIFIADKNATEYEKTHLPYETVERPWGYYSVLNEGEGFLTKCITVNPGQKLSLQRHYYRNERWIVLLGTATVIKGDKTLTLQPEDTVFIDVEEIHSLQNLTSEQIKILEIQEGDILDENDIERLEDIYGRV